MALNTGMIPVFEDKLKKLIKKIEKEYEKPKAERDKNMLKVVAKEARGLKKMLKKCREQMGGNCCPHCGEAL